jgi:peptidylprolyl isomerase
MSRVHRPANRAARHLRGIIAALCAIAACGAAADDTVVAQRGADQITVAQVRAMIASADPATRHRLTTDQSALKALLRDLLVRQAVLEQAKSEKWDQRPEVASLLQRVHDQAIVDSFLAAQASLPAGFPSDAEIQAAYDQNKSRLMQPRQYHLAQLYLARPPNASAEDMRHRLAALRGQIQHGRIPFDDAAKRDHALQFKDFGWVSEQLLAPQARTAVAGLPESAISDPLCGNDGCQLIRLIATRPAAPAPFADAREALEKALKQQKQAEEERAYASGLLAKQPVSINEIALSHVAP